MHPLPTDSPRYPRSVRFFLGLLMIAVIWWLGGVIFRALIANELFETGTLVFDPDIPVAGKRVLFQLIYAATITVLISYTVVLFSATMVVWRIPLRMRENGWLLMASILFFLWVPVEIFTGVLDYEFIMIWHGMQSTFGVGMGPAAEAQETLLEATLSHRIGALSGVPVIATLCYFTSLIVLAWQPLRGVRREEAE
jgi:hypothetical protein